jgi:hypothetical protein
MGVNFKVCLVYKIVSFYPLTTPKGFCVQGNAFSSFLSFYRQITLKGFLRHFSGFFYNTVCALRKSTKRGFYFSSIVTCYSLLVTLFAGIICPSKLTDSSLVLPDSSGLKVNLAFTSSVKYSVAEAA